MHRRSLVDERVALGNRMVALLKCYFPTIIELNPAYIHAKFFATGTKAMLEARIGHPNRSALRVAVKQPFDPPT